jgi:hypothetical protein
VISFDCLLSGDESDNTPDYGLTSFPRSAASIVKIIAACPKGCMRVRRKKIKKVTGRVKFSDKQQRVAATFYKERYVHCRERNSVDKLFPTAEASDKSRQRGPAP